MPGSSLIKGIARKALVQNTALSVTGSAGTTLGVYDMGAYARIAGIASIVGSGTIRYRMGVDSANLLVTSSFVINSGPSIFDVLNYGHQVELGFSQLSSQAGAKILILADPSR